ncbi:MAG TPA: hypothetical protein VIA62_18005 [Thermoanaerobaculia bacterium]|jgi:hypothetical protein|nr:hypothetical protein [Thermoanaerobaculia bacterium]
MKRKPSLPCDDASQTASLVVRQIPDGVTLVSASGTTYPVVPAN